MAYSACCDYVARSNLWIGIGFDDLSLTIPTGGLCLNSTFLTSVLLFIFDLKVAFVAVILFARETTAQPFLNVYDIFTHVTLYSYAAKLLIRALKQPLWVSFPALDG